jgi:hypothetical protein
MCVCALIAVCVCARVCVRALPSFAPSPVVSPAKATAHAGDQEPSCAMYVGPCAHKENELTYKHTHVHAHRIRIPRSSCCCCVLARGNGGLAPPRSPVDTGCPCFAAALTDSVAHSTRRPSAHTALNLVCACA